MKWKWLLCFAVCVICAVSCSDKPKEEPIDKGEIGKYLYVSEDGLFHSRKSCRVLQEEKDLSGHDVNGIEFVDTALVCPNFKFYYCKKCITDEQYEHIERIIKRNRNADVFADSTVAEVEY